MMQVRGIGIVHVAHEMCGELHGFARDPGRAEQFIEPDLAGQRQIFAREPFDARKPDATLIGHGELHGNAGIAAGSRKPFATRG